MIEIDPVTSYNQAWGVTEYMEWRYVIRIQRVTVFRYSYIQNDIIRHVKNILRYHFATI